MLHSLFLVREKSTKNREDFIKDFRVQVSKEEHEQKTKTHDGKKRKLADLLWDERTSMSSHFFSYLPYEISTIRKIVQHGKRARLSKLRK